MDQSESTVPAVADVLLSETPATLLPRILRSGAIKARLTALGFADLQTYLRARYVDGRWSEPEIGRELLGRAAKLSIQAALRAFGIRRRYRVPVRPRPQPEGQLDDGIPYYAPLGELRYDPDTDRVQCHLCGDWYRHLSWTHLYRHGWSREDYVRAFGLNLHNSLMTPTLSARRSELSKLLWATDPRVQRGLALGWALASEPEARLWPKPSTTSLEHRRNTARGKVESWAVRRRQEEENVARRLGFSDFASYWRDRRDQGWTLGRIAKEFGHTDKWARKAMLRIEGRLAIPVQERGAAERQRVEAAVIAQGWEGLGARQQPAAPTEESENSVTLCAVPPTQLRSKGVRGRAARSAARRREQEEQLANRLGFSDFQTYWQARRGQGWTTVQIAKELGHTDWWARKAMLRIEGSWVLPAEERGQLRSKIIREEVRKQAAEARQRAQEQARALSFESLVDYLLDRRLRGWGYARIAGELKVGQRRGLRLLQSEGLWAPRRSPASIAGSGSLATAARTLAQMGHILRRRREMLGLSLAQLSAQTGLSITLLFHVEHANLRVPLRAWRRIRKVLGITERFPRMLWANRLESASDRLTAKLEAYLETIHGGGLADLVAETGCSLDDVRSRLGPLLARSAFPNGRRFSRSGQRQ